MILRKQRPRAPPLPLPTLTLTSGRSRRAFTTRSTTTTTTTALLGCRVFLLTLFVVVLLQEVKDHAAAAVVAAAFAPSFLQPKRRHVNPQHHDHQYDHHRIRENRRFYSSSSISSSSRTIDEDSSLPKTVLPETSETQTIRGQEEQNEENAAATADVSLNGDGEGDGIMIQVQRLPHSKVEVRIPVPGVATQAAYDKVCLELSKTVSVPGFRKGRKIPPAVLEQAVAQQLQRQEQQQSKTTTTTTTTSSSSSPPTKNVLKIQAIQQLVQQWVEPTLKQRLKLEPIGAATLIEPMDALAAHFVPGAAWTLPVTCDVWPELVWKTNDDTHTTTTPTTSRSNSSSSGSTPPPYVGLTGSYTRPPPNPEKLNKALADLQERYAELEPIADPDYVLVMGDACTVNMVGYFALENHEQQGKDENGESAGGGGRFTKGEPLPSSIASGDRVEIVLGPGRYMEGLVEGLIGAKVGDTRTVCVSFPEKLRDKTLAGKTSLFDVEILAASRRIVPALTDALAARVRADWTKASLVQELQRALEAEDAGLYKPARNQAIAEALRSVVQIGEDPHTNDHMDAMPDALITKQAREKYARMMADMRANGVSDAVLQQQITPENFLKYKAIVQEDIVNEFVVSMALDEIARMEGIAVPDAHVQEQLAAIRKDASPSELKEMDEPLLRAKVENTLLREAVYDWLADRSNLIVQYPNETDTGAAEPFDEALLNQLAADSLQREAEMMSSSTSSGSDSVMEQKLKTELESSAVVAAASINNDDGDDNPNPTREETEEERQARYASMPLDERAYQILKDIGSV